MNSSSTPNKDFYQVPISIKSDYVSDATLRTILHRYLPSEYLSRVDADLRRFSDRINNQVIKDGEISEIYEPRLDHVDVYGRKVDNIILHESWKRLHNVAAEEGLVSIGYERELNEFSRIYQFSKLYLFSPFTIVACPLAMTDGAARLVEVCGDAFLRDRALSRLISRDPKIFSTSGQWMTERTGGSDVSGTSTVAIPLDRSKFPNHYFPAGQGKEFQISGYKYFTSATSSEMAFTLARARKPDVSFEIGSKGLTCFYVDVQIDDLVKPSIPFDSPAFLTPTHLTNCNPRHPSIQVAKLKKKLGTKALPTSELELTDLPAYQVGESGRGVPTIALMFNITRLHNAISSIGAMRCAIATALDYAQKRSVFGKLLKDQPLHINTLTKLQVELEAGAQLVFHSLFLQGKLETNKISLEEEQILRLLIPLIKLYTGKSVVKVTSEILESFGGLGYMEDSGIPKMLRESQVLPIWEGTTNVLSLDVLRTLKSVPVLLQTTLRRVQKFKETCACASSVDVTKLEQAIMRLSTLNLSQSSNRELLELIARDLSFAFSNVAAGGLLLEHLQWISSSPLHHHLQANYEHICSVFFHTLKQRNSSSKNEQDFIHLDQIPQTLANQKTVERNQAVLYPRL